MNDLVAIRERIKRKIRIQNAHLLMTVSTHRLPHKKIKVTS